MYLGLELLHQLCLALLALLVGLELPLVGSLLLLQQPPQLHVVLGQAPVLGLLPLLGLGPQALLQLGPGSRDRGGSRLTPPHPRASPRAVPAKLPGAFHEILARQR